MGNFNDIVPKRLNVIPARQATLQESQNAPIPFDKYYTLKPTRDIKKLQTFLMLPPFRCPAFNNRYHGQLLFQYNVVAPAPFYILNQIMDILSAFGAGGTLTVKWRIGTTVFRYFIFGSQRDDSGIPSELRTTHNFPFYSNQLVPINCVFEFWSIPNLVNNPGLDSGLKILLNFLTDPPDPDKQKFDITIMAPLLNDAIGNNLPLAMPVAQQLIAFISN